MYWLSGRVIKPVAIALILAAGAFWIGLEMGKKLGAYNSGTVWCREMTQIFGEVAALVKSGADSQEVLKCIGGYSNALGDSAGSEDILLRELNRIRSREIMIQEPVKP